MLLVRQFGVVEDVQVVRVSESTPRSRATVQYGREEQALHATSGLSGRFFGKYRLYAVGGRSQPYLFHSDDPGVPMVPIVYLKGINPRVDARFLHDLFQTRFGAVELVRRSVDAPNGRPFLSKGVFVLFRHLESAVEACLQIHGRVIEGLEKDGEVDAMLFNSTRGREANTGIELVREFRNKKRNDAAAVPTSDAAAAGPGVNHANLASLNRQQQRQLIPPLLPELKGSSSSSLLQHQQQQQQQRQSFQSVRRDIFDDPQRRRIRRHSADGPPPRNLLAPSSHQRHQPYPRRENEFPPSASSSAAAAAASSSHHNWSVSSSGGKFRRRRPLHPRRTSRGEGKTSKDPSLKSSSSTTSVVTPKGEE